METKGHRPGSMTARERILASLSGKVPDRIPWAPFIDGYYLTSLPDELQRQTVGFSIREHLRPGVLPYHIQEIVRYAGIDFLRAVVGEVFDRFSPAIRTEIEDWEFEEVAGESQILRRYTTSVGALQERLGWNSASPMWPYFGLEYLVKSLEDLRIYQHIWENTHFLADEDTFSQFDAYIGDDGLPAAEGPQTAVEFLIAQVVGLQNFYYLLQDHRREMEGLIETIHGRIQKAYRVLAHSSAKIIIAAEDTSSTTTSPAVFRRYSLRHLNEYAGILHAEGKIFLAHMCGRLKAMAHLIAESGLDGVESLTPPSIGDLDAVEARAILGEDKVIVGGINADTMLRSTPQELKDYAVDLLTRMAPGRKFILSNADAMPYGVPVENLKAVSDAVRAYGQMPLVSE